MYREIISIIIIIFLIISMDMITEKYTKKTVEDISNKLIEVRNIGSILKKNEEKGEENKRQKDIINEKINLVYDDWKKKSKILSYYLEHDEIEKVETDIVNIKSFVEVEDYDMTIEEIDSCIYVLNHIENKEKLSLSNIL